MPHQSQFTPSIRAGPSPGGGQATPEHEARGRVRETAYRPDGTVAGVREREFWQVWRQPALLQSGSQGHRTFSLRDLCVEALLLFVGGHLLLLVAIAGGALAKWIGWNPVLGYAATWLLLYVVFIRPRL